MLAARLAEPGALGTVQAITEAAYRGWVAQVGGEPVPMTEDYAPRLAAGQVWLVAQDGTEVGVLVLEPGDGFLAIFSLAVLPAAQGAGVGRWMLGFVDEQARAHGAGEVRLYTNARMARNIRIYERAGFSEVGRRENPARPGWVAVDMVKPVAP